MIYKVTRRYQRGTEAPIGTFKTFNEARNFIQERLAEDALLRVNAVYGIYEGMDLMEEFDQSKLDQSGHSEDSASGSQQRGAGQTFSPSPFSMTPQPKGLPRSGIKYDDKKDDEQDK